MKRILMAFAVVGIVLVMAGCASTKAPTGVEQHFFSIQTNLTAQVVWSTNVVTLVQTNFAVQTVTVTNQVGVVVPVLVTNFFTLPVFLTNVVQVTNLVAGYTLTPNTNATAAASLAGTLSNLGLPGVGSLVTMGLLGIFGAWAGVRNRQYAGENSALQQTSGVLAQNIQTFMAVLEQTPQGKQLAPLLKSYLATHQLEAGVIAQAAELAKTVDPLQAQGAAQQILAALGQLKG